MNLQVGKQQFSFPNATAWFNTNCNNLQIVTLYDTGWVPLKEKVQQFMTYTAAPSVLEVNANTVVSSLEQLKNYLNTVIGGCDSYRAWALDLSERRRRDIPEGCPKDKAEYVVQAGRAYDIKTEAQAIRNSVARAEEAARDFLKSQEQGGTGYNAQLERTISELEGAGKTAETGKKYGQYALIGLGVVVFAFIIIKLRKR